MKVLLLSHAAGAYGAERVLLALAEGLAGRGHQVVVDFPLPGPAVDLARRLGVEVCVARRARLPRNGVELARWAVASPASAAGFRRAVRQVAPDVAWVSSIFHPWGAAGARLARRTPVVWHLHETNVPGIAGKALAVYMGATADILVAVSDYAAQSYTRHGSLAGRTRTLHNPLLRAVQPAAKGPGGPFTVGFLGQLEPRKRAPDLALAIARTDDVHAVFIGDGKARRGLERAVRAARVEDRVRLLGFRDDPFPDLALCHCLAIPSVREPFGLVALEAMAAGLPVIAARSGALPEVLGDAALFHAPADPADLADKIARVRDDPALRDELRERGFRRIKQFGMERWLDEVEVILQDAAQHPRHP